MLFDVSHMGQIRIEGDNVEALERLVVAAIKEMPVGKVRYTLLTNERGGIIDDLLVTQGGYYLMLVVNASRKHIDIAHLRRNLSECDVRAFRRCCSARSAGTFCRRRARQARSGQQADAVYDQ